MGLTSNTGLLATDRKTMVMRPKSPVQLQCAVTPAPFALRPLAGLYNPFSHRCSILCNHPADTGAREVVKKAKASWNTESKINLSPEELAALRATFESEKEKRNQDIVTEDMFRRYTDTDSRPLTPAPTLASGKSRGSRRCFTPDQAPQRTLIVVDLRRSHSQETLYYRGHSTSELTSGAGAASPPAEGARAQPARDHLPPLASPLVLARRAPPPQPLTARKNQLKALNLGKAAPKKGKAAAAVEGGGGAEETERGGGGGEEAAAEGEVRRRGRRRRKGRHSADRLTSAGLAAGAAQDPETQIAGIGTDSHNASSRGSLVPPAEEAGGAAAVAAGRTRAPGARRVSSFLDDDILKFLHREVDQNAIETEFDAKRRYVLEEAMRTRPDRPYGSEMQSLLRDMSGESVSLADWLHIPRVFSRQSATFSLPLDSALLQTLSPMQYAARYVTLKKSKQLLYLTVLQKLRPNSYKMPLRCISEGLVLMMGGTLKPEHAEQFRSLMSWDTYEEEINFTDEIKLTLAGRRESVRPAGGGDGGTEERTVKYRTWCGLCAVCERCYGRFHPRDKDPPDGMEQSDFSMLETKMAVLNVDHSLVEILNVIRTR